MNEVSINIHIYICTPTMVICPCSHVCLCVQVCVCVCVSTDRVSTWLGLMPLILSHTAVPAAQSPGGSSPWGPGRGPVWAPTWLERVLNLPHPGSPSSRFGDKIQPVSSPYRMEAVWEDSLREPEKQEHCSQVDLILLPRAMAVWWAGQTS